MVVAGGSAVTRILHGFEDRADVDLVRGERMRTVGITMARISELIGEKYKNIGACQDLVEEINLDDTFRHYCLRVEWGTRSFLQAVWPLGSSYPPKIRCKHVIGNRKRDKVTSPYGFR